jgi:uncharacterized protein
MLIGREKERQQLKSLCKDNDSKLVAVYGRRRVGKTYFINEFFKEHESECTFMDYTGAYNLDAKLQISNFVEKIDEWFGKRPKKKIASWNDAFQFLRNIIASIDGSKKVIIFLDEVPWIDKSNKNGFIGALGYFWNDFCEKRKNIYLILCGSNSSWIKNKLLKDSKGPLYNRVTSEIHIKPLDLKETGEYLANKMKFRIDAKTAADIYMILGGIPYYLDKLNSSLSINENINNLFFNISSSLYDEYKTIFKSLFKGSKTHKQIIELLCKQQGGYTYTDIAKSLNLSTGGTLTETIEDLVECGFIGEQKHCNTAKTNAKYVLLDPFLYFHNKWLKNYTRNQLAVIDNNYWDKIKSQKSYEIWCGFAFEITCLNNIKLVLDHMKTTRSFNGVFYWNHTADKKALNNDKGAEIDFVIEHAGDQYDIVECKFYNKEYSINKSDAEKIKNKIDSFSDYLKKEKKKFHIRLVFLTSYGCSANQYYNSLGVNSCLKIEDILS